MTKFKVGEEITVRESGYSFRDDIVTITRITDKRIYGYVENNEYTKSSIWCFRIENVQKRTPNKNVIGGKLI